MIINVCFSEILRTLYSSNVLGAWFLAIPTPPPAAPSCWMGLLGWRVGEGLTREGVSSVMTGLGGRLECSPVRQEDISTFFHSKGKLRPRRVKSDVSCHYWILDGKFDSISTLAAWEINVSCFLVTIF